MPLGFHGIEKGSLVRQLRMQRVVMEVHLPIRQRADRNAVLPYVGDQHDPVQQVLEAGGLILLVTRSKSAWPSF
jgi:hypothetical protein